MSNVEAKEVRNASLKLSHAAEGRVLTAKVPSNISHDELARLATSAFEVISKMTGHPCLSGQIKFVVEDNFMNDVIRVDLHNGRIGS
jgi:hypothetical protein